MCTTHMQRWLCSILLLLLPLLGWARDAMVADGVKSINLRTHSISQPYIDSNMQNRWFEIGGDAVIRTDQYIRLTGEFPSRSGWIWSRVPLTATNWEIEVEFKIRGEHALYGDGMALWLTKTRAQQGPVFGSADKFDGLGIFIDTYKNNRPGVVFPYVMAMVGDGQTAYDKENDGKANELAGCSGRNIRNNLASTKLRLRYLHDKSLTLSLKTSPDAEQWETCFSVPSVKIPSVTYLGLTAETGELFDNHDIISIETHNLYQAEGTKAGEPAKKVQDQMKKLKATRRRRKGGWTWFFIKFFMFGLVVLGGYVGWTAYRSSKGRF